ncbi:hypothetical protein EXN66_Car011128 [Channa argus]|uniref:Uncharacterized protein n=1 Tax=Channa argus TaxID=215402 RepID=A0A6G1PYW0_CHAAH|nr:hypothetical protein EXN66_Car011128 [Channa argus]
MGIKMSAICAWLSSERRLNYIFRFICLSSNSSSRLEKKQFVFDIILYIVKF